MRDSGWLRTAAASLFVCAAGGALLWQGTSGFRALTTEQARRLAVQRQPAVLPEAALVDQSGAPFTLGSFRGQPVAVDFVYTQCVSVCPLLSAGFQRIDRAGHARTGGRLQLVSISFDPRDTPDRLREYASRYQADGRVWRFASVRDTTDLAEFLDAFGIVVIPDGRGDFQHNAAVHVLNVDGRLARVLDGDASPEEVFTAARSVRAEARTGTLPR